MPYKTKKHNKYLQGSSMKFGGSTPIYSVNDISPEMISDKIAERNKINWTPAVLNNASLVGKALTVKGAQEFGDMLGVNISDKDALNAALIDIKESLGNPENTKEYIAIVSALAQRMGLYLEAAEPFIAPFINSAVDASSTFLEEATDSANAIALNVIKGIPGVGTVFSGVQAGSKFVEAGMALSNAASSMVIDSSEFMQATNENIKKLEKKALQQAKAIKQSQPIQQAQSQIKAHVESLKEAPTQVINQAKAHVEPIKQAQSQVKAHVESLKEAPTQVINQAKAHVEPIKQAQSQIINQAKAHVEPIKQAQSQVKAQVESLKEAPTQVINHAKAKTKAHVEPIKQAQSQITNIQQSQPIKQAQNIHLAIQQGGGNNVIHRISKSINDFLIPTITLSKVKKMFKTRKHKNKKKKQNKTNKHY